MNNIREAIIRHLAEDESRNRSRAFVHAVDHRFCHIDHETEPPEPVLRVAAYCRVQDDFDHGASAALQEAYYRGRISGDPLWIFAGFYVDIGAFEHQDAFQRMMCDAAEGKIDLLLTRSIHRFARNACECVAAAHRLRTLGITILFEAEQVSTKDGVNDLVLAIAKWKELEAAGMRSGGAAS